MADGFAEISRLAAAGTPFLFIVSYDKKEAIVRPIDRLGGIRFQTPSIPDTKPPASSSNLRHAILQKAPVPFETYRRAFDRIVEQIERGNTYLLNLTFSTPIETPLNLPEIFALANAPYKLLWPGRFVCFSPEPFVKIQGDRIATFPMKGTIDAAVPDAERKILADAKEMAEHVMVVDLLRNDLGIVATNVQVKRFRYIDRIEAADKTLLQVSSHIEAKLPADWPARLGEILEAMLPAGSITGTPKKRTCDIIEAVETHDRGFFTGVFGYFDGKNLESAVMIRFIEERRGEKIYKSGGGLTIDSDPWAEYQEMIDKVYLPL